MHSVLKLGISPGENSCSVNIRISRRHTVVSVTMAGVETRRAVIPREGGGKKEQLGAYVFACMCVCVSRRLRA